MSSAGPEYMTYASLFRDLQRYLERGQDVQTDQTVFEQIPTFINDAERKIVQVLKLQGVIEVLRDAAGFTPGRAVLAKPDRWRETVSLSYLIPGQGRKFLYPRGLEYVQTYWPDVTVQDPTQPPLFYADYDYKNWLIGPTSPSTYAIEALCYMQPPLLCESNQTNFFTNYTPVMLRYGALLEAQPFIKGDERIPVWQQAYETEIAGLTNQDLQKILDRSSSRSRP